MFSLTQIAPTPWISSLAQCFTQVALYNDFIYKLIRNICGWGRAKIASQRIGFGGGSSAMLRCCTRPTPCSLIDGTHSRNTVVLVHLSRCKIACRFDCIGRMLVLHAAQAASTCGSCCSLWLVAQRDHSYGKTHVNICPFHAVVIVLQRSPVRSTQHVSTTAAIPATKQPALRNDKTSRLRIYASRH